MIEETIYKTALKEISNYTGDAWDAAKSDTVAATLELMFVHGVCAFAERLLEELKEETINAT